VRVSKASQAAALKPYYNIDCRGGPGLDFSGSGRARLGINSSGFDLFGPACKINHRVKLMPGTGFTT
jgi:hypothetical protein